MTDLNRAYTVAEVRFVMYPEPILRSLYLSERAKIVWAWMARAVSLTNRDLPNSGHLPRSELITNLGVGRTQVIAAELELKHVGLLAGRDRRDNFFLVSPPAQLTLAQIIYLWPNGISDKNILADLEEFFEARHWGSLSDPRPPLSQIRASVAIPPVDCRYFDRYSGLKSAVTATNDTTSVHSEKTMKQDTGNKANGRAARHSQNEADRKSILSQLSLDSLKAAQTRTERRELKAAGMVKLTEEEKAPASSNDKRRFKALDFTNISAWGGLEWFRFILWRSEGKVPLWTDDDLKLLLSPTNASERARLTSTCTKIKKFVDDLCLTLFNEVSEEGYTSVATFLEKGIINRWERFKEFMRKSSEEDFPFNPWFLHRSLHRLLDYYHVVSSGEEITKMQEQAHERDWSEARKRLKF